MRAHAHALTVADSITVGTTPCPPRFLAAILLSRAARRGSDVDGMKADADAAHITITARADKQAREVLCIVILGLDVTTGADLRSGSGSWSCGLLPDVMFFDL